MKEFGFSGFSNLTKTRAAGDQRRIVIGTSTKSSIKLTVETAKLFGIDFGQTEGEPGYRAAIGTIKNGDENVVLMYLTHKGKGNKIGGNEDGGIAPLNFSGMVAYQQLKEGSFNKDAAGNYPLDDEGRVIWSTYNHNWEVSDEVYTPNKGGAFGTLEQAQADGIVDADGYVVGVTDEDGDPVPAIQARILTYVGREEKRMTSTSTGKTTKKASKPAAEKAAATDDFI